MGKIKKIWKTIKKHKIASLILLLLLFIVIAFIVIQVYLYFDYLIGNDLVLKLKADNENFNLKYGEEQDIKFTARGIANPLCKIECKYVFYDLSSDKEIKREMFSLTPGIEKQINEKIIEERIGKGQELYRFSVKCNNVAGTFCQTEGKEVSRNVLIMVNYDFDKNKKEIIYGNKKNVENSKIELETDKFILNYLENETEKINLKIENFYERKNILVQSINETGEKIEELEKMWEKQEFDSIEKEINNLDEKMQNVNNLLEIINKSFYIQINEYNALVDALKEIAANLEKIKEYNMESEMAEKLDEDIIFFNLVIENVTKQTTAREKDLAASKLAAMDLREFKEGKGENLTKAKEEIIFNLEKIYISEQEEFDFNYSFPEIRGKCCLYGKCDFCYLDKGNYPVLFIHGHDFNKGISSDYSLNAFSHIQEKLDSEKQILDVGEFYLSTNLHPGRLEKIREKISFRGSFYFDVFEETNKIIEVQTKTESIDNYAIRLRDLIENIKDETGKDKVIIVAYSMGGLVSRRYIQLFGESSVDKLILLTVPNKGIVSDVKNYCGFFGAQLECRDLDSKSLFLNKLNKGEQPSIPVINIFATGCSMKDEYGNSKQGDGVILEENSFLEDVKNVGIEGSCSGINLLHNDILTEKYPQVYEEILKAIKD